MIDLTTNTAKQRALVHIDRQMSIIERVFIIAVLRGLRIQFNSSAKLVSMGSFDFDQAVNENSPVIYEALVVNYKRIAKVFGDLLFDALERVGLEQKSKMSYETKSIKDEYNDAINKWLELEATKKIRQLDKTTKEAIKTIIDKGYAEGLSNAEMATAIRKIGRVINRKRALKIVRTETHTAAMKSMSEAMQTTRLQYTKSWVTAGDSRVRSETFNHVAASGETVGKDEFYTKTGEALFFPGDPRGSAGNIINCRCIEIFNTFENILRRAA